MDFNFKKSLYRQIPNFPDLYVQWLFKKVPNKIREEEIFPDLCIYLTDFFK